MVSGYWEEQRGGLGLADCVRRYGHFGFSRSEKLLLLFGPAPSVVGAVRGGAVLDDVELGCGNRSAPGLFGRMISGPHGAVRVENAPGVPDGGVGGDDPVFE